MRSLGLWLKRPVACRRNILAVLFVAGLLSTLLAVPTVLADDPDQPAHTHFAGQLPPPETDGTAIIQWGGGSLYQLTARLAVNGCDLNRFWVYDDQARKYTAPYTFDGPSFLNARFNRLYADNIPPTTLWVKCIDMIEHVYGYGLLNDHEKNLVEAWDKGKSFNLSQVVDPLTDCGDHWSNQVRDQVLRFFPITQQTCIVRFESIGLHVRWPGRSKSLFPLIMTVYDGQKQYMWFDSVPAVVVYSGATTYPGALLSTELHELCHAHEYWYTLKFIFTYDYLTKQPRKSPYTWSPQSSAYLNDFVDVVGFGKEEDESWSLPSQSIFREGIYGSDFPWELSAELCSRYLMRFLGEPNLKDIRNYNKFLTSEVIDWLEKYIFVLPESRIENFEPNEESPAPQVKVAEASEDDTAQQVDDTEAGVLLSGLLLNSDGQPQAGVNVKACTRQLCHYTTTDANGAFSRRLEEGEYWFAIEAPNEDGTSFLVGYYAADAPGNLTTHRDAATIINLIDDIAGIEITLP